MKIAIRYYSKTGNTKKLADAIAKAIDVKAETVDQSIPEDTDILFLGSSVYAAGIDDSVTKFIEQLDRKSVKKVINFSTAALLPSTYKQVKELVEKRGIQMAEQEFHCRGSFSLLHRNKPDDKDLLAAAQFAKKVINL